MNYISLASLLILLCAGTQAQQVECGVQCSNTCQLYGALFNLPLLSALQETAVALCSEPCNAACSCAESCNSACSTSGELCPPSFPPSVGAAECYVRNADCLAPCLAQCTFKVAPAILSSADAFRQGLVTQLSSQIANAGTALKGLVGDPSLVDIDAFIGSLEKEVQDISQYLSDILFTLPNSIVVDNVQALFNQSVHGFTGIVETVLGDLAGFDLTNVTAIFGQLTQGLGSLTQILNPLNPIGGLNEILAPLTSTFGDFLVPNSPVGQQSGLLSGLLGRKRRSASGTKRSAKRAYKKPQN